MLLAEEKRGLNKLQEELADLGSLGLPPLDENVTRFSLMREILHLYERVMRRFRREGLRPSGEDVERLRGLAGEAIGLLDGQAEPSPVSLKEYSSRHKYGPFLGVSDEGSAASDIRDAALASPKMRVINQFPKQLRFSRYEPIVVGVAHDAESLGAAGEVVVGPEEYRDIRLECIGWILTSTNVGSRVNMRYYKKRPVIAIDPGSFEGSLEQSRQRVKSILEPFWQTPNGIPRPLTVFLSFADDVPKQHSKRMIDALVSVLSSGEVCNPECHKLGVCVVIERNGYGVDQVKKGIDLAFRTGLMEVVVDGSFRRTATDKISMPGLLNFFEPQEASKLLSYAQKKGIQLDPVNQVDTYTVSRSIWSALTVARDMGLELGKYGLFPLTLEESDKVIESIQRWFSSWTAAPAFYVDLLTMDSTTVYTEENIEQGVTEWLRIVAKHKVPVALIDTADKDKGRRLIKDGPEDNVGILNLEQIAKIDDWSRESGVRILWAGGLTLPQVFEMGRLGVFGIYVTSAASCAQPVSGDYAHDPMLSEEKEPTFQGVYRAKLLLEAGYHVHRLERLSKRRKEAESIKSKARAYLETLKEWDDEGVGSAENDLASAVLKAWEDYLMQFIDNETSYR